jgi:NAD(P)H-dependent FMN reductase
MRILALIGSSRALGNTELLVTEVAKAAVLADQQTSVRLLRLTDLRLDYCNGCMSCAMEEGGPCPLDDDMDFLLSEYHAADAIILGAPAYTMLPPGPLKLIADRLIMYLGRSDWSAPKPAVTLGVAGLARWSELLVPLLNCTVLSQGYYLVDSFLAIGAGPGEVLLDATNVQRAQLAGERLGRALAGENIRAVGARGCCPVCSADFFRFTDDGIECPLCLAAGKLKDGVAVFEPSPPNRWEPAALKRHFTDWIQGTGPAYLEKRSAIRPLLRPYRQRPFPLISPEREGGGSE